MFFLVSAGVGIFVEDGSGMVDEMQNLDYSYLSLVLFSPTHFGPNATGTITGPTTFEIIEGPNDFEIRTPL